MKRINELAWKVSFKLQQGVQWGKKEAEALRQKEDGDTNFISVMVLLGIAMIVAAVFMGFKDQLVAWAEENILKFFS